jgi:L-2,4-diaminobutyric acid acetyltransferase
LGIEAITTAATHDGAATDAATGSASILLREPIAKDGADIWALIEACPPLDRNSLYCNLLQCTDFAETCVVAERAGELVGWISGYVPPSSASTFFVWQVAVAPQARGEGLALRMLEWLLGRPAAKGARLLTTTITQSNAASWALFSSFARRRGSALARSPRFWRDQHFGGAHETEWEAQIPLAGSSGPRVAQPQTMKQEENS